MTRKPSINVAVIPVIPPSFDPLVDPKKRPHCYWEQLLDELKDWGVGYDLVFSVKTWVNYQAIIVSSGAASDLGNWSKWFLQYIGSEGRSRLDQWIEAGNILFCEIQSQSGNPIQFSYDTIFGKGMLKCLRSKLHQSLSEASYEQTWISSRTSATRGSIALVNKQYHAHPLLYGVHPFLLSDLSRSHIPEFPDSYPSNPETPPKWSLYPRCTESLYSGWFTDWSFGWIPLLIESETGRWPVLLVRMHGKGVWIASTLRLTTTWSIPLIRNILNYSEYMDLWETYHDEVVRHRHWMDGIILALAFAIGILTANIVWQCLLLLGVVTQVTAVEGALGVTDIVLMTFLSTMIGHYLSRPLSSPLPETSIMLIFTAIIGGLLAPLLSVLPMAWVDVVLNISLILCILAFVGVIICTTFIFMSRLLLPVKQFWKRYGIFVG